MTETLAQRIFTAHLELSLKLGRKVTMAEFGQIIATQMKRGTPFSAAAVSRWERGQQLPTPDVIEAIAAVAGLDPGWISHGMKSAAPQRSGEFPKYSPSGSRPAVDAGAGPATSAPAGDPAEKMSADPNPTGGDVPPLALDPSALDEPPLQVE